MKNKIEFIDGMFYITYYTGYKGIGGSDAYITKPLSYFIELYDKHNIYSKYKEEVFGFKHINNKYKEFIYNVNDIVYCVNVVNQQHGIFQLCECKIKRRVHENSKDHKFSEYNPFTTVRNMLKIKVYEVKVIKTINIIDSIGYLVEFNKLSDFEKANTGNPNTMYDDKEILYFLETQIYKTPNIAEQHIINILYDTIKIEKNRISNIKKEIGDIQNTIKKIICEGTL